MSKKDVSPKFRWLTALPLVLAIAIAATTLADNGRLGASNREYVFDFYQRVKPTPPTEAPVRAVFIDIDAETLERSGEWPWPRTRWAGVLKAADEAGATKTLFDIPLAGADPSSPEIAAAAWSPALEPEALDALLAAAPRHDAVLGAVISETGAVVSLDARVRRADLKAPAAQRIDAGDTEWLNLSTDGQSGVLALPPARADAAPASDIALAASALATPNLVADSDGIVRRVPLLWAVNGAPRPALALAGAMTDGESISVETDDTALWGVGPAQKSISVGGQDIAVHADGSLRLYLPKNIRPETISAWRLLEEPENLKALNGAVAVIGSSIDSIVEAVDTASGQAPRGAVQAELIEQIASGRALSRPVWASPAEAAAVLLLAILAIFTAQRFSFWPGLATAFVGAGLAFAGSWTLFDRVDLLIDPLPAASAAFFGAVAVSMGKLASAIISHDAVRSAVDDSLPESTVAILAESGDDAVLQGALRDVTVLTCQIQTAEEMDAVYAEDPGALPKLMRDVGKTIRARILESGGAAEDIEAGRINGYWNAPLDDEHHHQHACAAALSLIESLDDLNADLEEAAQISGAPFSPIHLNIGISSGSAFVGAMGGGAHKRYSAIGAPVDIAGSLRSRARLYGPAIIVDETVYRESHHRFAFLELDLLQFAGEGRPAHIYALLGNPFIKASPRYRNVDEVQRNLLAAYRTGDWQQAEEFIEKARGLSGANPALYNLYEARLAKVRDEPAPESWTGAETIYI